MNRVDRFDVLKAVYNRQKSHQTPFVEELYVVFRYDNALFRAKMPYRRTVIKIIYYKSMQ